MTKIAAGDTIYVSYQDSSPSRGVVKTGSQAQQTFGALRFLAAAANPAAKPRNFYARSCIIAASGDAALKQETGEAQLSFSCELQQPAGGYPELVMDGVALPLDSAALLAALGA